MRTIHFQETDRVPLYDILQNDAIIEHYSREKLAPGNGARLTGIAIGRILDMTRMAGGPTEKPQVYRAGNGMVYQQERWTAWVIERPFHDMPGLVEWVKEDIRRIESQTFGRAYAEAFHAYVRERMACFAEGSPDGDPTVLVVESLPGLTYMYSCTGLERFAYLMADHPDLVEEWFEALCQAELRRIEAIACPDLIPVALTADDIAFKTGPIFSPAWLRSAFMPRLKRLNDAWHTRDTFCLFHSDGNLWPVLEDLVAAGIDGLNPLEVLAGMSLKEVRQRFPRLVLTGGIDVSRLLTFGTPQEVREACLRAIADTGGIGYFLGSTTELHWDVRLENAVAMFETALESPMAHV